MLTMVWALPSVLETLTVIEFAVEVNVFLAGPPANTVPLRLTKVLVQAIKLVEKPLRSVAKTVEIKAKRTNEIFMSWFVDSIIDE